LEGRFLYHRRLPGNSTRIRGAGPGGHRKTEKRTGDAKKKALCRALGKGPQRGGGPPQAQFAAKLCWNLPVTLSGWRSAGN